MSRALPLVLGLVLTACATPSGSSGSAPTGETTGTSAAEDPAPGPSAPAGAGAAKVSLSGCLSQAGEEAAAQFPVRAATRSAGSQEPDVTVAVTGLGVMVTHALEHACCLEAQVGATVEQGVITVAERLEGTACRCRCSSEIKTEVGLAPGEYALVVTYEGQEIHRQAVTVKRLLAE